MQADLIRPAPGDSSPGPLSGEDRRLLAEIGFLALTLGMPEPARRIFEALPEEPDAGRVRTIGLAMVEVLTGQAAEAVRRLHDKELVRSPGDPDLTAFLAVALLASGRRQQAVQLLEPVAGGWGGSQFTPLHSQTARRLLDKLAEQGALP